MSSSWVSQSKSLSWPGGVLKLGVEGFLMANHGTSYFLVQQIPAFDG